MNSIGFNVSYWRTEELYLILYSRSMRKCNGMFLDKRKLPLFFLVSEMFKARKESIFLT